MAIEIDRFGIQVDPDVADQRFGVRDPTTGVDFEFGGDLLEIRRSGSEVAATTFVNASTDAMSLHSTWPLVELYAVRHLFARRLRGATSGPIDLSTPSGDATITLDPVGDLVEVRGRLRPARFRLALRRASPPGEVALTLSADEAVQVDSNLYAQLKVFQWAARGGYDQPEGWQLGPMGSWARVDADAKDPHCSADAPAPESRGDKW